MQKYIFLISIVLITAASCTTTTQNTPNSLAIFNGISFELQAGEKELPIDKNEKETYSQYFGHTKHQIPLLKYVRHADYEIFVGVPYRVAIQDLQKTTQNYTGSTDSTIFFHQYNHKDTCFCEYATHKGKQGMIYIAIRSLTEQPCAAICTETALSNRLTTNHHE